MKSRGVHVAISTRTVKVLEPEPTKCLLERVALFVLRLPLGREALDQTIFERRFEKPEHTSAITMTTLLAGKVAAITGAVTGIGRAIALEYLRQGAAVAVNHFPDSKSESQFRDMKTEAGSHAKLIAVPGDIAKPETGTEFVSKVVSEFGKLDVFVSNAGVCQFSEFLR